MRPGDPRGSWGMFGSFPYAVEVVVVVLVRSVVLPGRRQVRSGNFGSFPCALGVSCSLGAFGPFPCALGVFGFVRVRSVHSRSPLRSSGSFGAFGPFPYPLGVVG